MTHVELNRKRQGEPTYRPVPRPPSLTSVVVLGSKYFATMVLLLSLSLLILSATPVLGALSFKGVDWSSVVVEENAGYTYKTSGGTTEALEKILAANGVNTVRQRVVSFFFFFPVISRNPSSLK
jgi:hypothetical protein